MSFKAMSYHKGIIDFDNIVSCEELQRSIQIALKQSKQLVIADVAGSNQQKFFRFVLQDGYIFKLKPKFWGKIWQMI